MEQKQENTFWDTFSSFIIDCLLLIFTILAVQCLWNEFIIGFTSLKQINWKQSMCLVLGFRLACHIFVDICLTRLITELKKEFKITE